MLQMALSGSETPRGAGASKALVSVSESVGDIACSLLSKCCRESAREPLLAIDRADEGRNARHNVESRAAKELDAFGEDLLSSLLTLGELSVLGTREKASRQLAADHELLERRGGCSM